MMGKYEPLGQFLRKQKRDRVPMTFAEIEKILNAKLPASKTSRAFWSNNPDNNVMTRVWVEAGFETKDVSPQSASLVFHRKKKEQTQQNGRKSDWNTIFGSMQGMITFAPGFDPTAPAYSAQEWQEIEREWSENWDVLMQPFNQP
jgi:hypothetical protein